MDLVTIAVTLKTKYPKQAREIRECLALLLDTIDSTMAEIQESSTDAFHQRDFEKFKEITELANGISRMENEIKQYIDIIEPIDDDDDQLKDEKTIPEYNNYLVDMNTPHTLYEDFTHKRPAAFMLESQQRINVRTWKDILLLTCTELVERDKIVFESFIDDPTMHGTKMRYFEKTDVGMSNPEKITGTDVFVETNMDANNIRYLIVKMLRKYGIRINDFTVYFRADLTALYGA
jgi:hypothetical protein